MTNPYPLLGLEQSPCYGRAAILEQLERALTKDTPDHISVIGRYLYGKSFFLKKLHEHFAGRSRGYVAAIYWDLKHRTPDEDDEFVSQFADKMRDALKEARPDVAEFIGGQDASYELLEMVADDLAANSERLLLIMDGLDDLLAKGLITKHLWDNLRELGMKESVIFVAGSRRSLAELCDKTMFADVATSDFWRIFNANPVRVGPFGPEDWVDILAPLRSVTSLTEKAEEAIVQWTAGVPVFAMAVLRDLHDRASEVTELTKQVVDESARDLAQRNDVLTRVWRDCSVQLQEELTRLASSDVSVDEVGARVRDALVDRGFATESGGQLSLGCKLVKDYARIQQPNINHLKRMFGTVEEYSENIRTVFRYRREQIPMSDVKLASLVDAMLRDLDTVPDRVVDAARNVAVQALSVIWDRELPEDKTLPDQWIKALEIRHFRNIPEDRRLPTREHTAQVHMLRCFTGSERDARQLTRYTSRNTYLLLEHLHWSGNFGNHPDATLTRSLAESCCVAALALCDSLDRDSSRGA